MKGAEVHKVIRTVLVPVLRTNGFVPLKAGSRTFSFAGPAAFGVVTWFLLSKNAFDPKRGGTFFFRGWNSESQSLARSPDDGLPVSMHTVFDAEGLQQMATLRDRVIHRILAQPGLAPREAGLLEGSLSWELGTPVSPNRGDGLRYFDTEDVRAWAELMACAVPRIKESLLEAQENPRHREEVKLKLMRDHYDRLGPERPNTTCRMPGCNRGTVSQSIYCRTHHFEIVFSKPCPFNH